MITSTTERGNMKEIKFRYRIKSIPWDDIVTKIFTLAEIEGGSICLHYTPDYYEILSRDQFTGLKDKNGTDIYERVL